MALQPHSANAPLSMAATRMCSSTTRMQAYPSQAPHQSFTLRASLGQVRVQKCADQIESFALARGSAFGGAAEHVFGRADEARIRTGGGPAWCGRGVTLIRKAVHGIAVHRVVTG